MKYSKRNIIIISSTLSICEYVSSLMIGRLPSYSAMNHLNKIKIVGLFAVASFSQFLRLARIVKMDEIPTPRLSPFVFSWFISSGDAASQSWYSSHHHHLHSKRD